MMKWEMLEVPVGGTTHRARYRVDKYVIEVETIDGRHRAPRTGVRPEIVVQNIVRQAARVMLQAA